MAVLRPLLDRMLAGEVVAIPAASPACTMSGEAHGRCLRAEVRGPPSRTEHSSLLVTVGIAGHSRCGAHLWQRLHAEATLPVVTQAIACPPEPWCAASLHAGITQHPRAAHWLGDFELCLAWAWLEIRP